jgi:tripeptide aminopeptidase
VSVATLEQHTARPAHFRVEAAFLGFAAEPRVILAAAQAIVALGVRGCDERTSVTIEAIHDGGGIDADRGTCSLLAEVRSADEARAEAAVAEVIDALHDAANRPECTSDVDISVQRTSAPAR